MQVNRKPHPPPRLPAAYCTSNGSTEQANPCLDCHEVDPAQFAQTVHGLTECLNSSCRCGFAPAPARPRSGGLRRLSCRDSRRTRFERAWRRRAAALRGYGTTIMRIVSRRHAYDAGGDRPVVSDERKSPGRDLWHLPRLRATCAACVRTIRPIEAYTASVHAAEVALGNHGASCSDCHTAHSPLQAKDPASSIYRLTCRPRVARVIQKSPPCSITAFMVWPHTTAWWIHPFAPIVTVSTVFLEWPRQALRCLQPISRSVSVAPVIQTCDWVRNTDWPQTRAPPIRTVSMALRGAAVCKRSLTAPAVMASITSCPPATPRPTFIRITSRTRVASATSEQAADSQLARCICWATRHPTGSRTGSA